MILHHIEQGTQEWLDLRAGRVTGTRFKTLLMTPSTKGYKDLVSEVAAEIITGGALQDSTFISKAMEDGTEREPFARADFIEMIGQVKEVGFITPDEDHVYSDWVGFSPDGLVFDNKGYTAGLEIKCPMAKTHLSYLGRGKVPPEYVSQVQAGLYISGLPAWYFMSYYKKMKPLIILVHPDIDLHKEFEKRLGVFVKEVSDKIKVYNQYGAEGQNQAITES